MRKLSQRLYEVTSVGKRKCVWGDVCLQQVSTLRGRWESRSKIRAKGTKVGGPAIIEGRGEFKLEVQRPLASIVHLLRGFETQAFAGPTV